MTRLFLAALILAIFATRRGRWWLADVLTDTAIALAPPIPREYDMTDGQAENHGDFVSAVTQLADQWKKAGLISGPDIRCRAPAPLPARPPGGHRPFRSPAGRRR